MAMSSRSSETSSQAGSTQSTGSSGDCKNRSWELTPQMRMADGGRMIISCGLPIPHVKGKPIDYRDMKVDQLKEFINYVCCRVFRNALPSQNKTSLKKPDWWGNDISFNRLMSMKGPLGHRNQSRGRQQNQRDGDNRPESVQGQLLRQLLVNMYVHYNMRPLMGIGAELAQLRETVSIMECKENSSVQNVMFGRYLMVQIDRDTLTYDMTGTEKNRKRRSDVLDEAHEVNASDDENSEGAVTRSKTKSGPSHAKIQKRNKTEGKKKRPSGEKEKQSGTSRKLFPQNKEEKTYPCRYCSTVFRFLELCNDHEGVCPKGPPQPPPTLEGFMNSLGMVHKSKVDEVVASTSTESHPYKPRPAGVSARGRVMRKCNYIKPLLQAVKSHPLPITSKTVQKLVAELGEKVDHTYPPAYERDCKPRSGYRSAPEKEYKNVMKKAIAKDSANPHIYTYGRRQREIRNQELVIGVKQEMWPSLNQLKTATVRVNRLQMTTLSAPLKVPPGRKPTYLETKWAAAINLPRIRLVDLKHSSNPDIVEVLKEYEKNKVPISRSRSQSKPKPRYNDTDDNTSTCSSSSNDSLFRPISSKLFRKRKPV